MRVRGRSSFSTAWMRSPPRLAAGSTSRRTVVRRLQYSNRAIPSWTASGNRSIRPFPRLSGDETLSGEWSARMSLGGRRLVAIAYVLLSLVGLGGLLIGDVPLAVDFPNHAT